MMHQKSSSILHHNTSQIYKKQHFFEVNSKFKMLCLETFIKLLTDTSFNEFNATEL